MPGVIIEKEKMLEMIKEHLDGLPAGAAVECQFRRGINEVLAHGNMFKEYRPGRGVTITIKIEGGARDGICGPDEQNK